MQSGKKNCLAIAQTRKQAQQTELYTYNNLLDINVRLYYKLCR